MKRTMFAWAAIWFGLAVAAPARAEEPGSGKLPITEKEWNRFVEKMNPFTLIQRIREAQARAAAEENLKKLGKALQDYQNQGFKPNDPNAMYPQWYSQILPYIEQGNLYQNFSLYGNGSLGARFERVSEALQAQLNLEKEKGLLISEVDANSAAAKAGLRRHDILLQWDGKDVAGKPGEFEAMLRKISEKQTVSAQILRAGKKLDVKGIEVRPGAAPAIRTFMCPSDGTSNTLIFPYVDGSVRSYVPNYWTWSNPGGASPAQSRVFTTTFRQEDRFTARYQEGSLIITITGQMKNDVAFVKAVKVIDGMAEHRYESIDKTPDEYRDKARDLIKAAEKNQDRIEIQRGANPFAN